MQVSTKPLILTLAVFYTVLHTALIGAVPDVVNQTHLLDPSQIIPPSFTTYLQTRPGRFLEAFQTYRSVLFGFTYYAVLDYQSAIRPCTLGCEVRVIDVLPNRDLPSRFTANFALWGLYSCTKKIREAQPSLRTTFASKVCTLQMPSGYTLGRIIFRDAGDRPVTDSFQSPGSNDSALVVKRSDEIPSNSHDFLNVSNKLAQNTSTLSQTCRLSNQCHLQTAPITRTIARINRLGGSSIPRESIIFALLETQLKLAAQRPRPRLLQPNWSFMYTSGNERITVKLKLAEPRPAEADHVDFLVAIESLDALVQRYELMFLENESSWQGAEFDIRVGGPQTAPVITGSLMNSR